MSGKGSISRMSDECLIKQETVVSFYTQYQAVMRKFTLADITACNYLIFSTLHRFLLNSSHNIWSYLLFLLFTLL